MRHPWPLLALAVVLACNDGGDEPASPAGTRFTIHDPRGDTLALSFALGRAHDVLGLHTAWKGDSLLFTVRFAELVRPYSSQAGNALLGIIDFDVDDDPTTGKRAIADGFGGTSGIGAEWSLFLEDSVAEGGNQRVALVNLETREIWWIPGRYEGSSVTAVIPRPLMRIGAAGRMRLSGAVGSLERVSDIFPNEGAIAMEVPAMAP